MHCVCFACRVLLVDSELRLGLLHMQVGLVDVEGTMLFWSSGCSGGASYRYVPFFAPHLLFCISFAACYSGSGLTSLCMHVYLFASVLFCMQLLL